MASPQTEDGFLKIANEIVEFLCRFRISGQEWQILWVVLKKTWGWNKRQDHIPGSQFAKLTGLDRRKCYQILQKLIDKNIVTNNGVKRRPKYGFNKNYETWKLTPKKTLTPKRVTGCVHKGVKSDTQKGALNRHYKDTYQKKGSFRPDDPRSNWKESPICERCKKKRSHSNEMGQWLCLDCIVEYEE